ncbi:hypothetical protein ACFC6L_21400 [Kitasatospora phosalacinea]|uniref:hypothetical protein n=1 Tax=Kitasatospora phosalacinea TaxID=2065 RepID=UPI0035E10E27
MTADPAGQQTDVVGVWFTVESEYRAADARSNSRPLDSVRKTIDAALANAAEVSPAR